MSNESVLQKLKDSVVPGLFTGAFSAGIFSLYVSDPMVSVPMAGMNMPAAIAVGLGSTAGDIIGNAASEFILPMIPSNKYSGMEGAVLTPALSGAGTYLVLRTTVSDQIKFLDSFLIGTAGAVAGGYTYNMMHKDKN